MARVIDTPGHTRGQINFYFPDGGILLSGDTLFSLGCGRLIEGTAEEMYNSLRKLADLPGDTKVCCGHDTPKAMRVLPFRSILTMPPCIRLSQRSSSFARLGSRASRRHCPTS